MAQSSAAASKSTGAFRTEVTAQGEQLVFRQGHQKLPNGDEYFGEFVNNRKHGKGILQKSNGDKYEGEFAKGLYHGRGTLSLAEHKVAGRTVVGWKYQGEWKHGMKHGTGLLMPGNGDVYQGSFEGDKFHGYGEMRYASGDAYQGGWMRGLRHGKGTLRFRRGGWYQGQFYRNMYHGAGEIRYGRGSGSYVGGFKTGRRSGVGKRVWASGSEYEGEWKEDCMEGKGVYKNANGDMYVGEFRQDRYHGQGVVQHANGDRYTGQFQYGVPCGVGRYEYATGGYYEGQYWALVRTGIKWRRDAEDEANEEDPDGDGPMRWLAGAKKLNAPAAALERKKQQQARRDKAYDVKNPLSKAERMRRHMLNRQYGRIIVGSEHDDPSRGGVLVPARDGKRHGRGVRVFASGARYEGDWYQGEMHGFGVYVGAGPTGERYEGGWERGQRHGRGVASYGNTNGGKYVCPLGRLQHGSAGRCIYDGEWASNRFEGQGKFMWADGRSYEGEFKAGQKQGWGSEVIMDQETLKREIRHRGSAGMVNRLMRYEGQYVEGQRTGKCRMYMATGDTLEGRIIHGRLEGPIKYTFATGRVSYASFRNGKRERWLKGDELREALAAEATMNVLGHATLDAGAIGAALKARSNYNPDDDDPRFMRKRSKFNLMQQHVAVEPRFDSDGMPAASGGAEASSALTGASSGFQLVGGAQEHKSAAEGGHIDGELDMGGGQGGRQRFSSAASQGYQMSAPRHGVQRKLHPEQMLLCA